jgi:hypothetical protein
VLKREAQVGRYPDGFGPSLAWIGDHRQAADLSRVADGDTINAFTTQEHASAGRKAMTSRSVEQSKTCQ